MQTVQPQYAGSSLTYLLIRYMDGQIAEQSWEKMMQTFDHGDMTTFERMAYARFMNDVIADTAVNALYVPKPDELEEILQEIRS